MNSLINNKTTKVAIGAACIALGAVLTGEITWQDSLPSFIVCALAILGRFGVTKVGIDIKELDSRHANLEIQLNNIETNLKRLAEKKDGTS